MRIVFDAYELIPGQGKSIGIYNYAKNLLKALVQVIDDKTEIFVICNPANIADFTYEHDSVTSVVLGDTPGKFLRLIWIYGRAAWILKSLKAEVYFSPKGFMPKHLKLLSANVKTVVVIHDLIPLWYAEHYPGYFGHLEEFIVNSLMKSSVEHADSIVAISQATANDIKHRLGRTENIHVVHNGIPITVPAPRPFDKPYIFAMASQLPHKNIEGILVAYAAYRKLESKPLPLVICGVSNSNQLGVISVKGLDDATLHAYYAYADLFVFLSLIEGFGFPPVEALAHGTAVICSDIPVLREVTKGYASYVPPTQAKVVGEKMVELLAQTPSDEVKRERMAVADSYTWLACANGVLKAINS